MMGYLEPSSIADVNCVLGRDSSQSKPSKFGSFRNLLYMFYTARMHFLKKFNLHVHDLCMWQMYFYRAQKLTVRLTVTTNMCIAN